MIGIFTFVLFAVIAIVYAISNRSANAEGEIRPRYIAIIAGIVIAGLVLALAQPYAVQKVDVAHVGLRINLIGDERGMSTYQYRTGWVVYNVYTEEVVEIPSSQQHVDYKGVSVFAKGGFSAIVAPSFNYEIVPEHAGEMYVSLRRPLEEIRDTWLYTAAIGAMNDVTNRWTVDDIFNKREQFEAEVMAEVNKRVGKWFNLSQIRTNITPPAELANAINEKTKAVQEAQQMEAKNRVIQMENLNKIMTAKGDSSRMVIDASGRAKSIAIIQQQVTPEYIEYLKVQTWNGVNPTTLVVDKASTAVMVK